MVIDLVVGVVTGLVVVWLAVIAALWAIRGRFDLAALREALRMLPDLIRLLKRLAADSSLPRGVRIRLGLLVAYLLVPIDLVPDFIPIIGYADDAIIVAVALRSVVRHAGPRAIERHWPGTGDGLTAILRLAGVTRPSGDREKPH